MTDEDFDFRPPAERREPKQFQPPPWEEEAFQRLQEKRAPEEPPEAPQAPQETPAEKPAATAVPPVQAAQEQAPNAGAEALRAERERREAQLDEATMMEMFAKLSQEDPPATAGIFQVALGASLLLFALGGMLLIWAMAAFVGARRTGTFGLLAGFVLAGFGAGFIGSGWWMVRRALKRRGVL